MDNKFRLLMISAMYENGGNTVHRFLDGHPQMFVYPFESQLGTKYVFDHLTSIFPTKYRWPEFSLDATRQDDYRAVIDEEMKVRTRTPHVSKFRHMPFQMSDEERLKIFLKLTENESRSRGSTVAAYFQATFQAWRDCVRTGEESIYVGYSPIVVVDTDKIMRDLSDAHLLHVVRNPWSAYADTKKRPVPLSLAHYLFGWTLNQYFALLYKEKYPGRVHIVRLEDVLANSAGALAPICQALGLEQAASLRYPSWNGRELEEVFPWGTIRKANTESNLNTAAELSAAEIDEVRELAWQYLDTFDYRTTILNSRSKTART